MNDRLIRESDALKAVDNRIKELSIDPAFVRKHGIIDVMGVKKAHFGYSNSEQTTRTLGNIYSFSI